MDYKSILNSVVRESMDAFKGVVKGNKEINRLESYIEEKRKEKVALKGSMDDVTEEIRLNMEKEVDKVLGKLDKAIGGRIAALRPIEEEIDIKAGNLKEFQAEITKKAKKLNMDIRLHRKDNNTLKSDTTKLKENEAKYLERYNKVVKREAQLRRNVESGDKLRRELLAKTKKVDKFLEKHKELIEKDKKEAKEARLKNE